jgi:hypothetical protein
MTEPLENVRVGMTGRHAVVVTRELTVGAHMDGMAQVRAPPPGVGRRLTATERTAPGRLIFAR